MGKIIFDVFIAALTVYLMTGFILNKICELKNDRWHNYSLHKPSEEKEYLVLDREMKMSVAVYDSKNFEFPAVMNVTAWRELPETTEVIGKIQKNPFFRKKKKMTGKGIEG